jgi:hypothetical protein
MKAMLAVGLGALVLGGVLVAHSGRSASAQSSVAGPAIVSQAEPGRTTLVNCGEGRLALVYSDPLGGAAHVQCVAAPSAIASDAMMPGVAGALPVSQFAPAIVSPVRPAVQERVVYREATPAPRRDVSTVQPTSAPSSRAVAPAPQTRSWKKSALIIGGSTAAGAGVGAILGGGSGAKKGGVVGLLGGTIYDVATRSRH